jgi:hypothetical protein
MSLMPGRRWLVFVFVCVAVTIGWAEPSAAQTLTLRWDPSPDPTVVGYIVYAGTRSGQYSASFNVGAATSFTYGVVADQPYFFAVASYAAGMIVGPVSGEAVGSARTPALLSSPADQSSMVGSFTQLKLFPSSSFAGTAAFSAAGLPPGLSVNSSTGLVSGTPTTAGSYVVVGTASDAVSTVTQTFTWTILAAPQDDTAPVVTITLPGSLDRLLAVAHSIPVGGVAADNGRIAAVTWTNSRGGSGAATGTDVWLAGVVLHEGRNHITITAIDQSGNRGTATFSIYRQTLSRSQARAPKGCSGGAVGTIRPGCRPDALRSSP